VQGEIASPRVKAEVTLQDLAVPDLQIGASNLTLEASAAQGFAQPINIRTEVRMSDVTASDPRLASLLADGVQLSLAGRANQAGTVIADRVDLHAGALRLTGAGQAEQWGAVARSVQARLAIADLATIGAPFGLPGTGAAQISLTLAPAATGERLVVEGTGQGFSLGQPIVDRLMGQAPRVQLALEGTLPQSVKITTAQIIGAKARLDVQGALADHDLDLSFTGTIEDAAAIDPALAGKGMIDGTIYGTLDQPSLVAELNAPALIFAGHRADAVKLSASARDLLTTPKIELEGTASLDGLAATAAMLVAVEDARIAAPNLVVTLGKSRLAGDVALVDTQLVGDLAVDLPDLSEIGRVAGPAMRGNLSATVALDAADGRQSARVAATGQGIFVADDLNVPGLELKASAVDLFRAPTVSADVELTDPVIGGYALSRVSLNADGPLSGLQTKISLSGPDLKAAAVAEIARVEAGYRIDLRTLTADVKDIHVENARPATIEIQAQETRIEDLALAVEDGMLSVNGSVSPADMSLAATIESLPLAIAQAFAPDLSLKGRIDGEVQLSGTPAAPNGRFTIAGKNIGASDAPGQQADLDVTGTLQQGRLDLKGGAKPKAGGALAFTVATTNLASDARLEARVNGTLDLALVDAFLAGGADRVAGKATLDLAATGALAAPLVTGTLSLSDGGYENLRYGIKLRAIAAELRADGPVIQVVSLSATTPGGGQVSGQGKVDMRDGVAPDLTLQTRGATIIDTDLATATVDSDLVVAGNLRSRLTLGGKVKILKAEIRVPDKLPPDVQEIEVIEINASPQVAARIAARAPPPRQSVIMGLDLAVNAPQQLAVRGHGLDVELGGAIHVGGTTSAPDVDGAFKLRHGSLDVAGKRLDFSKGQLTFEGGDQIDPILDLTAVTRAQDTQVTARVEGSARAPRITLSSVPTLPEDEILARLLFGKSAGALSPFELLQLAQATAELAGVNTGPGVLDKLRKSTGLDRLSLEQTEGTPGPSLSAGRYVAEGVYVGVSQGAKSGSGAATVEIELTPNIKLESEVGASSGGKAGVNLEWDY
jgi:translocation and assembly module TamB